MRHTPVLYPLGIIIIYAVSEFELLFKLRPHSFFVAVHTSPLRSLQRSWLLLRAMLARRRTCKT